MKTFREKYTFKLKYRGNFEKWFVQISLFAENEHNHTSFNIDEAE